MPTTTTRSGLGSEAAGYIPTIPDPMGEVQKALGLYTANIPGLISGAGQINQANQQQLVQQITDLYPQFKGNVQRMGTDIGDWAAGNISQSTQNALAQAMAERGGAMGMGPNAASTNAALMAVLGKTTEGLQAQSIAAQNALLSGLPKAPLIDPTKLGPSPNELLQTISQGDLLNAYIQAAPNPEEAYRRAKKDAMDALAAGKAAATGPFAGGAPTGGGVDDALNKFLNALFTRATGGSGGGGGGGTTVTSPTTTAGQNAWLSQFTGLDLGGLGGGGGGGGGGTPITYQGPGLFGGIPDILGVYGGGDGVPYGDPSSHTPAGSDYISPDEADFWASMGVDIYGENVNP